VGADGEVLGISFGFQVSSFLFQLSNCEARKMNLS